MPHHTINSSSKKSFKDICLDILWTNFQSIYAALKCNTLLSCIQKKIQIQVFCCMQQILTTHRIHFLIINLPRCDQIESQNSLYRIQRLLLLPLYHYTYNYSLYISLYCYHFVELLKFGIIQINSCKSLHLFLHQFRSPLCCKISCQAKREMVGTVQTEIFLYQIFYQRSISNLDP